MLLLLFLCLLLLLLFLLLFYHVMKFPKTSLISCRNMENARIWYAFKNIPGLVGCIEAVVKVLDDAADGLMTVVIVGDGTA